MTQVNPDAEKPDIVVKSMHKARQKIVLADASALKPLLLRASERGKAALGNLSASEWEAMKVKANDGSN